MKVIIAKPKGIDIVATQRRLKPGAQLGDHIPFFRAKQSFTFGTAVSKKDIVIGSQGGGPMRSKMPVADLVDEEDLQARCQEFFLCKDMPSRKAPVAETTLPSWGIGSISSCHLTVAFPVRKAGIMPSCRHPDKPKSKRHRA